MGVKGKDWLKRSIVSTGVLRLASQWKKPGVAILMYHSVMPEPQKHITTLGEIIHSAELFRRQMEAVARCYNPVSLNDVLLFVQGEKRLPARPVVVTFDDGYSDNPEFAAPILNQVGIPAAFYVTVGCLDRAAPPWVARLRYAFHTMKKSAWSGLNGTRWRLTSSADLEQAFTAASEHCARLTGTNQETFVSKIEHEFETGALPDQKRLMMTWDQARQLVRQGHIVGSHTVTHPNLAYVADEPELRYELEHSKRRLEQELSAPAIHFSYPCPILQPHWSARSVQVCRELGYRTAVTTNSGPVYGGDDPLTLRRVRASKDVDELRWILDGTFLGRAM